MRFRLRTGPRLRHRARVRTGLRLRRERELHGADIDAPELRTRDAAGVDGRDGALRPVPPEHVGREDVCGGQSPDTPAAVLRRTVPGRQAGWDGAAVAPRRGEPGVVRGHLRQNDLSFPDGSPADDRAIERRAGVARADDLLRPVVPEDAVEDDDAAPSRLADASRTSGVVDGAALTALSPLGDGLVSKEGAVEEERVAARPVEERPAVLRLVVREGAVDEHRAGDAVVDRPSGSFVGVGNVDVVVGFVPGERAGADRHPPIPAADLRVVDGAALDHGGVAREEAVLDQDVGRGGEAGRTAVVGRPVPLEHSTAHRHVRTGILNVEPSASGARSVVAEAAPLDSQGLVSPLLVAELDRSPIARLVPRLIRAGGVALKTAIDEPEVA